MLGRLVTKRVYDEPLVADGYRVLVDRLWPRGESHEKARVDRWLREIAPSSSLRTWWNHDPERMEEFATQYQSELDQNVGAVHELADLSAVYLTVTLVYAARDKRVNHAVVLQQYMQTLSTSPQ